MLQGVSQSWLLVKVFMISHSLHNHVKPEPIALHIRHNDITKIIDYRGTLDALHCVYNFLNFIDWKVNPSFSTFPFILPKKFYFLALYNLYADNRIAHFLVLGKYRKWNQSSAIRSEKSFIFNLQFKCDLHQNTFIECSI